MWDEGGRAVISWGPSNEFGQVLLLMMIETLELTPSVLLALHERCLKTWAQDPKFQKFAKALPKAQTIMSTYMCLLYLIGLLGLCGTSWTYLELEVQESPKGRH
eukprot:1798898-Amphidinium_carterae.1